MIRPKLIRRGHNLTGGMTNDTTPWLAGVRFGGVGVASILLSHVKSSGLGGLSFIIWSVANRRFFGMAGLNVRNTIQ